MSLQFESRDNLTDEQKLYMARTRQDVYDVGSPTVPSSEEMIQSLTEPGKDVTFSFASTFKVEGAQSCDSHVTNEWFN